MYLAQQVKIANTYIRQMYLTKSIEDKEQFLQKSAQELVGHLNSINGMHTTIYDMNGKGISM